MDRLPSEVLGDEPMRLARSERQEMVQMLSAEGMSTRAIAPIVGASQRTVADDIEQVSKIAHLDPVEGLDGKSYQRPVADPVTPKAASCKHVSVRHQDARHCRP